MNSSLPFLKWEKRSALRAALAIVAAFSLVVLALCELGMGYPVPLWACLFVAALFTAALVRRAPFRSQLSRVGVLAAVLAAVTLLHAVDWTSRKPFLRDLGRVRVGMSEAEVRQIMGGYIEGTGWPAAPFDSNASAGTLAIAGSSATYPTVTSPDGQMLIRESLVFRHSTDPAFNSDWGIVSFSDGRVVRVDFSAD